MSKNIPILFLLILKKYNFENSYMNFSSLNTEMVLDFSIQVI